MSSIRKRLFIVLLVATSLVWLSAVAWIQHSTRQEVSHVLDRRLEESARMVASLIGRQGLPQTPNDSPDNDSPDIEAPLFDGSGAVLARQLVCQVWGLDGALKSESAGAPNEPLAPGDATGFTQRQIQTPEGLQQWRVYTHVDAELGIRVMVGDALAMREGLVRGVIIGLLTPALFILPALALLIWLGVGRGLQPLTKLTGALRQRGANDLQPVPSSGAPTELAPMIGALNGLFLRLKGQREREQTFTAFAAHELKTPLAGLKTQAQIAAIAPDDATRNHALRQILRGVERTDRLARQLLDLTAAEAQIEPGGDCPKLGALLKDVLRDLADMADRAEVNLNPMISTEVEATCVSPMLTPALRNLIENAIQASPRGETVLICASVKGADLIITIADRGPGIASTDRSKITERFVRGAEAPSGKGSGLGLAIVEATALRMKGRLCLEPGDAGGEKATLVLPHDRRPAKGMGPSALGSNQ